jgi:sugar phosphate isomerase/epimerase
MKQIGFLLLIILSGIISFAQTADDKFRRPLKDVLTDVQKQYDISLRYTDDLVKDKWVTYAGWRFMPNLEKTLSSILAPHDISFAKEGEKKYKLQPYQYHLKTVEEGKEQLRYLASLYSDKNSWEQRRSSLKKCILSSLRLNNLPASPNSRPIITAVRKMDGYTVENIAIETLPGLYVSGSLYKPAKFKGKIPLVLNPDGHFSKGRYRPDCQYRCAALAKMGAMAFSYDLFGWDGESLLQVKSEDHRKSLVQSIQTLNAIRILDFLLARKDVDSTRIAVTGASGGGSQTMLLTAIDDRIKLSVPVAMMSSYHSGGCPCESGMGIHLCEGGTNNVEIASMAAPRPQLVVSDGKDWTQNVPVHEFPFVQNIYNYYNANEQVKNVHLADEGHDYGFSKRKAMYEFIADKFNLDLSKADESKVVIENETALYVFGDKGEKLPVNALKGFDVITNTFEQGIAAQQPQQRYKVAVVDLMILKRQKLGAFQLTKDIGADGVEVDMGGLGSRPTFDNKLLIDSVRKQFLDKAKELNLEIPSLAMTGYYAQSFCERPIFIQSIEDCIATMKLMNVKVAFLPLGVQCDLVKRPELRDSVISRLKIAGALAEKAGVIIGIETALSAKDELKLLKDVNSKAVKSYFNFSNALKNGRDVSEELLTLGKDNIVQIHCTDDDGVWLQNNTRLDMKKVKQTLDKMKWTGWLVIERSRDASDAGNVKKNFGANTAYVKSIFQTAL